MTVELSDVPAELKRPVGLALEAVGVDDGHLAVELVSEQRIQSLNRDHRGRDRATDVLAFPLDGLDPAAGPRELGDVVICTSMCTSVPEAAVHGVLHLCGLDHERDAGEMLAVQREVIARLDRGCSG